MVYLVGLPSRDSVRSIVGELIVIPEVGEFGAQRERLNLTYTELMGMTYGQIDWYHSYMRERRTRKIIAKAKETPTG